MAKVSISDVLSAILPGFIISIFKKPQYCLWQKKGSTWVNLNPEGNSERKCKEAMTEICEKLGLTPDQFIILPKHVKPPER